MKDKNNKGGFTLIELLAVVVILGLLMMVAVPAVSKYVTQTRKETYSFHEADMKEAAVNMMSQCLQTNESECIPLQGETKVYTLQNLIDKQYSGVIKDPADTDKMCDFEKSYVEISYPGGEDVDITDLQYKVCLKCSKYKSDACENEVPDEQKIYVCDAIDTTPPTHGDIVGATKVWANYDSRTISVESHDDEGGCGSRLDAYTKTFTEEGKTGVITIEDTKGNSTDVAVNVYLDRTKPTGSMTLKCEDGSEPITDASSPGWIKCKTSVKVELVEDSIEDVVNEDLKNIIKSKYTKYQYLKDSLKDDYLTVNFDALTSAQKAEVYKSEISGVSTWGMGISSIEPDYNEKNVFEITSTGVYSINGYVKDRAGNETFIKECGIYDCSDLKIIIGEEKPTSVQTKYLNGNTLTGKNADDPYTYVNADGEWANGLKFVLSNPTSGVEKFEYRVAGGEWKTACSSLTNGSCNWTVCGDSSCSLKLDNDFSGTYEFRALKGSDQVGAIVSSPVNIDVTMPNKPTVKMNRQDDNSTVPDGGEVPYGKVVKFEGVCTDSGNGSVNIKIFDKNYSEITVRNTNGWAVGTTYVLIPRCFDKAGNTVDGDGSSFTLMEEVIEEEEIDTSKCICILSPDAPMGSDEVTGFVDNGDDEGDVLNCTNFAKRYTNGLAVGFDVKFVGSLPWYYVEESSYGCGTFGSMYPAYRCNIGSVCYNSFVSRFGLESVEQAFCECGT